MTQFDSHRRSLMKGVSWRITGSLDTLLLCYLFTGSIELAAGISATEVVTKVVLYYIHERIWLRIPHGNKKHYPIDEKANI